MIQEIDDILKKVRNHEMRTFEARVRILELIEKFEEELIEQTKQIILEKYKL